MEERVAVSDAETSFDDTERGSREMAVSEKLGRWLLKRLFKRYSGIESWNVDPLRMAVRFASQPVDERMVGRTFMGPGAEGYAQVALARIGDLL